MSGSVGCFPPLDFSRGNREGGNEHRTWWNMNVIEGGGSIVKGILSLNRKDGGDWPWVKLAAV